MNEFSLAFFISINIFSFIYFGLDKRKAKKNQHRIPETSLLMMTFFGGTIGFVFGMLLFNHKTSKKSFILKIVVVIVIQILILYLVDNYYQ